jgi:Raf kinase inhibitor-like YbhB/YbcL family protein
MRHLLRLVIGALAIVLLAAACGTTGREMKVPVDGAVSPTRSTSTTASTASILPVNQLSLTSPDFASGDAIPANYTCTGPSPALAWSGVPSDTKELALVVLEPSADNYLWIVTGIAATNASISKGEVPPGATQLNNSSGKVGWLGPCPAKGTTHTYNFMLFALPDTLVVTPTMAPTDVLTKIQNLAKGRLVILSGTFELGSASGGGSGTSVLGQASTTTTTTRATSTTRK